MTPRSLRKPGAASVLLHPWAPYAAIGLSFIAIAALLVLNAALPIGLALLAIAVSFGAWLLVSQHERRGNRVDVRIIAIAVGVLMVAAVALEPTASRDLWSYTMYGRLISHHGVSPYSHVPSDFPHDPFLRLVGTEWRNTASVYGPLFAVFSAVGSSVAGGSALVARLFHQTGAAIAVTISLVLIWRRTTSPAAVMLVGLNSLVIVSVVNNGHNDALVGLGLLGALLLTERQRWRPAGLALAAAALIKITALLALPALALWILHRHGRRPAAYLCAFAITPIAVGYAIAGPAAITALNADHQRISRASAWQAVRSLIGIDQFKTFFGLSHSSWISALGLGAIALVALLSLAVAWRQRRNPDLAGVVSLALTAYLVAGIYVLTWYCIWVIPIASLARRRVITIYVASLGAFITAVYFLKYRALPGSVEPEWHWVGAYVGPFLFLAAYLIIASGRFDERFGQSRPSDRSEEPAVNPDAATRS